MINFLSRFSGLSHQIDINKVIPFKQPDLSLMTFLMKYLRN